MRKRSRRSGTSEPKKLRRDSTESRKRKLSNPKLLLPKNPIQKLHHLNQVLRVERPKQFPTAPLST
jgi:hypothetical protein